MKDKEMIEDILEIAKFVNRSCGNVSCKECDAVDNLDEGQLKGLWCNDIKTAINIYNAGYRKIHKDSVVLSREEYEILKIKEKEKHWLETCMSVWKNAKIDGGKETAEKILFKFESAFAYYDNEDMFSKKSIFECIEEIAKSLVVEIKE